MIAAAGLDTIVLVPHASSATGVTRLVTWHQVTGNLIVALTALPPNSINRQVHEL
ncbi:MAG: hypothetical protein ABI351_06150 [Herbaspirillum sp.]